MAADLKRCPFCGQLPTTHFLVSGMDMDYDDIVDFEVVCPKCNTCKTVRLKTKKASASFSDVEEAMEKAKAAWNLRWDEDGSAD